MARGASCAIGRGKANGVITAPMIEAVILDMDGTLFDSGRTVPAAYAATILELTGCHVSDDEIIAAYSAGPAQALITRFIGRPATDEDIDGWLQHLEERLNDTVVYPGIRAVLCELAGAGIKLGVFTGAVRQAAELQLRHAGLRDLFEVVAGSDEVSAVKPAPDGLQRACDVLGLPPERAVYVGDALNDLRCARAAGATPIAAGWGHLYEPDEEPHLLAVTPANLVELIMIPSALSCIRETRHHVLSRRLMPLPAQSGRELRSGGARTLPS